MQIVSMCRLCLMIFAGTKLAIRQDIVGRPIRPAEDPGLLLEWFDKCGKSHQKCRLSPLGELPILMPTRVVDVGSRASPELRLRDGSQCSGPYATLSHCWGTMVHNRTTKSTLHTHMTSFGMSTLCKTMRDAVIVTCNLQLKYLWIDALCIIQDDPEDWEREAMSMSEIYTQSVITIAASSSPNGDGGCFFPRLNGPTAQLLWTVSNGFPPEKVSFRSHQLARYSALVDDAPLNKRAWVLQERSLSRRIVHFTTDRLYWECQEAILEEGLTKVSSSNELPVSGFQVACNRAKTRTSDDIFVMDNQWHSMVERYTLGQLTNKSDRLPALAGLAMIWAKISEDRYIAGCWQEHLPLSLLWTKDAHATSNHILQHPSWSWASFDGAVRFHTFALAESPTKMAKLVEEIVVAINGSTTVKMYGSVDEGFLTLTGRIKATIFEGDRTENEYDQHMPWTMTLDAKTGYVHNGYVHKRASFDSAPTFNSLVPILKLCAYDIEWERTEFVMLLQPLQQQNHFKRLGLGIITWKKRFRKESWFDDAPRIRLTIS